MLSTGHTGLSSQVKGKGKATSEPEAQDDGDSVVIELEEGEMISPDDAVWVPVDEIVWEQTVDQPFEDLVKEVPIDHTSDQSTTEQSEQVKIKTWQDKLTDDMKKWEIEEAQKNRFQIPTFYHSAYERSKSKIIS